VSFVGVLMMVVPVEHRGFADGEWEDGENYGFKDEKLKMKLKN